VSAGIVTEFERAPDPFARRDLPPGELHLWHAELDHAPAGESVLSLAETERAARMLGRAGPRFAASRALVRRLLGAYTGTDAAALAIEIAGEGKPRLPGDDVRINLAHSGDLWIAAFTRDREVGVVVERLDRDVDRDRVAERIFAPREVESIRRLEGHA
jgi:4'-phosphopantetheinyl transferase